ncbi:MAG: hypothetical protein ACTHMM_23120 [Agriterribacter sp.]
MTNRTRTYILLLFSILILIISGCINTVANLEAKSEIVKQQNCKSIAIQNGIFKLELKSEIRQDTLGGQWEDDLYGTPVIKEQKLTFYKDGIELKQHSFPMALVTKVTRSTKKIEVVALPVFDVCLITGESGEKFYYVYGADFCNGTGCPEFTGLYDMDGNVVFEGLSTDKIQVKKGIETKKKYELDLNRRDTCQTIFDIWKK